MIEENIWLNAQEACLWTETNKVYQVLKIKKRAGNKIILKR